ncbi:glycerophosphodiester phosphodiesterase [Streptomyces sp. NPDC102415]|uniref:glycerophosphodiester phosphodiesterase n=1 Tax=Streptomyces sp. NPDC102415 TaxID=3366173 RepID=UPI0037F77DE8
MPFPGDVPSVKVIYTALSPAGGGPAKGSFEFTPTVPEIVLPDLGVAFHGGGTYALDDQGRLGGEDGVRLLPCDIPGANPAVWYWLVKAKVDGQPVRTYRIHLSVTQPEADLGAIRELDPDRAQYILVAGPPGADGEPGPPGSDADAQAYTDEALTTEQQRADAAYDPAGSATAARTAAINTAAGDATAKAAAAQAAAINAASTDATAKANAARDAAIAAAATDAAGKAATAQSAAISTASADATAKAATAQTAATNDAKTYTDSALTTEVSRATGAYTPSAAVTVTGLLSALPAYFGHRGQGMVAPEHTMAAYRGAIAAGAKAIEVSVNIGADGTLYCIHDLTIDRTTYSTGSLNTWTAPELRNRVLTNGRVLHGQGWTDQPIPTLREVLDEFLGKVVIFLEAKGNDAVVPMQTMLDTFYPNASRSVVWKAHIGTASLPWAKDPSRNYRTWVYLDDGTSDAAIAAKDPYIDYLGVQTTMSDARIAQIVARGKPVFSWPVYRRSQRDRLAGLGVVGFMTSDIQYVSRSTAMRTASRWDNQVKEPGGTPTLDYDSTYALKYDDAPNAGWVYINAAGQSYGLGTYCPIAAGAGGYRISFDMRFEGIPALTTEHAGIYFGKASDDAYRFGTANATGGYHMVMRANGQMQLNRHTAGVTTGTALGTVQNTTAVVADNPMTFQIDVTPTTVELRRTDSTGWTTGPIADTTYRGLYFGLSNGGITNLATKPHWRNLAITQL